MRELFLTLLAKGNAYGYELRQSLEETFGDLLPTMNAGQIYTTLARLERDGLVAGQEVSDDARGKRIYELRDTGRNKLEEWIATPIPGTRLKDEFFMKLILVSAAGLADPHRLIEDQRKEYLQSLRDIDALQDQRAGSATSELLLEGAILHLKADLEWLELIEQHLSTRSTWHGHGN